MEQMQKDDTSSLIIISEQVLMFSSVLNSAMQHFILQRLSERAVMCTVTFLAFNRV